MVSAAPGGGTCCQTNRGQSRGKGDDRTGQESTHRCTGADNHTGGNLPLFGGSRWTTVIHRLTSHACALRSIVLTWGVGPCLRRIIRRLSPGIVHGRCRRSRGAMVWGGGLLAMVDAQGGLILSRVRMGGVLLFGRFVRVLRPRQLLMLRRCQRCMGGIRDGRGAWG